MSKTSWGKVIVFSIAAAGTVSSAVTIGDFVSGNVDFGNWSIDTRIVQWILRWVTVTLGLTAAFMAGFAIKGVVQKFKERQLESQKAIRQQAERRERDELEKAKQQRKYILHRFDWLLEWHSDIDSGYDRHEGSAERASDIAQSLEFTDNLMRLSLISPQISDVPAGDVNLIVSLVKVRKKYEFQGLDEAQALVKSLKIPARLESTLDTSVD